MLLKFSELEAAPAKENIVPLVKKPHKSSDGVNAIIEYYNYRNDALSVAVTPEEFDTIQISKDMKFMKQPSFLEWKKGPKGPYLAHKNGNQADVVANTEW